MNEILKRENKWYRLDNAAMIIPSSIRGADTRVFRITCELNEEVNPEQLQEALNRAVREFPYMNVALRRGLFWYYLDPIREMAKVEEEHLPVCSPLYFQGRRNLLYRVSYYGKRINLEMFHVLSDGTGAFSFFERILEFYLSAVHGLTLSETTDHASAGEKEDDAFRRFYSKSDKEDQLGSMTGTKAYQFSGVKDEALHTHVAEILVSAGDFVAKAHEYKTTAGILATALYIKAIAEGMPAADLHRPIVISVPVNLRQYFPSETARNFFCVILVQFDASKYDGTLRSIVPVVTESFSEQLTEEHLQKVMNSYSSLTRNPFLRLFPILIKDVTIRGFNRQAKKGVTGSLSNVGRLKLQKDIAPYVHHFTGFMAASNMQISVLSYGDVMSFGAASGYTEQEVTLRFCRELRKLGLQVTLSTNDYDEEGSSSAVLSEV